MKKQISRLSLKISIMVVLGLSVAAPTALSSEVKVGLQPGLGKGEQGVCIYAAQKHLPGDENGSSSSKNSDKKPTTEVGAL